jgi:NAD(P)-dependent dehydrogenase (short-subunit alcohol dehydrogenase family)
MLAIRGAKSSIAFELIRLLGPDQQYVAVGRGRSMLVKSDATEFLFCQGMLVGKSIDRITYDEQAKTFDVNAIQVIDECDRIIAGRDNARIVVIGSESGFTWSHDSCYAASKAALHRYVETKRLRTPDQQLVCVAPGIISDSAMTQRRDDQDVLAVRAKNHPKGRWLLAAEVARLVHFLLYQDQGYISGTVIRMNGGMR